MKILLYSRPLLLRGPTLYTLTLARELRLRGHKVALMGEGGDLEEELIAQRIPLLRVPLRGDRIRDTLGFFRQISLARSFSPDIIHAQDESLLDQVHWLSRWLKMPHVATVHSTPQRPIPKSSFRQRLIVCNPQVGDQLERRWGIDGGTIDRIALGLPQDRRVQEHLDQDLGPTPTIGTVAYLEGHPGLSTFLRAAGRVREAGHNAHFLIVGSGPNEERLRRLVRELGLVDSVTISMARARPHDLYKPIDIFVSTSADEGLPMLTLTAMSRGKPIIALPSPLLPSTIIDGETVMLSDSTSDADLATAMIRLLTDDTLRQRLARRALEEVIERHPLRVMIDGTLKAYRGEGDAEIEEPEAVEASE